MRRRAFTLVELLVVIGIIAVLIAILIPVLSKAKDSANRTKCLSNVRQLGIAWLMYAQKHKDKLVYGATSPPAAGDPYNPPGIQPWVQTGNDESAITGGALFPYAVSVGLYRCVSDTSSNSRSYSVNHYLNGGPGSDTTLRKAKLSQIKRPAETFVFIEEYDIRGHNINSFVVNRSGDVFVDIPAFFHKGCMLGFADGHAEFMPYGDSRTYGIRPNNTSSPNNADLRQLQQWCGANY